MYIVHQNVSGMQKQLVQILVMVVSFPFDWNVF